MWGRESALSHKSVIFILEEFDLFAQVLSFGVFMETNGWWACIQKYLEGKIRMVFFQVFVVMMVAGQFSALVVTMQ